MPVAQFLMVRQKFRIALHEHSDIFNALTTGGYTKALVAHGIRIGLNICLLVESDRTQQALQLYPMRYLGQARLFHSQTSPAWNHRMRRFLGAVHEGLLWRLYRCHAFQLF